MKGKVLYVTIHGYRKTKDNANIFRSRRIKFDLKLMLVKGQMPIVGKAEGFVVVVDFFFMILSKSYTLLNYYIKV